MKAAYCEAGGGPASLVYGDVPDPELGPDTVLIRVHAISLEGGDLLNRRRIVADGSRHVVGYQASGVVAAVGSAVSRVGVGQRVVGFSWRGSHAELFAVGEDNAYPVPDGLGLDLAATIPIAFGTASDALFEFPHLKAGETVLVQGAAGGVGLAAVQLARRAGARVIATASSDERLARLAGFGADEGVDYTTEDIGARVQALTGGVGCDLVVDMAGGKAIKQLMAAVRYRGRFSVVGASSGDMPSFGFLDLIGKNLTVHGILFGREMATPRAHALIAGFMDDARAGRLEMPLARVFALDQASEAHAFAETGHPFGRILIKP